MLNYLAPVSLNFGPLSREHPHSPDINYCILTYSTEAHREPHNEVGSLSLAECLVGFDTEIFKFWLQRLNPLGNYPLKHPLKHLFWVYWTYILKLSSETSILESLIRIIVCRRIKTPTCKNTVPPKEPISTWNDVA